MLIMIWVKDLLSAFSYLPHLKSLALPSSIISPEDLAVVCTPLPKCDFKNALDHLPALHTSIKKCQETLAHTQSLECETMKQLGLCVPDIKHISFV